MQDSKIMNNFLQQSSLLMGKVVMFYLLLKMAYEAVMSFLLVLLL